MNFGSVLALDARYFDGWKIAVLHAIDREIDRLPGECILVDLYENVLGLQGASVGQGRFTFKDPFLSVALDGSRPEAAVRLEDPCPQIARLRVGANDLHPGERLVLRTDGELRLDERLVAEPLVGGTHLCVTLFCRPGTDKPVQVFQVLLFVPPISDGRQLPFAVFTDAHDAEMLAR